MKASHEPPELAALRRHWALWTMIIELFAWRSRARRRLAPGEYEALYSDLLAACQALAEKANAGQRAFYQELEELVRPWLNLQVLEGTDWEILYDLLSRCLDAGQKLKASRRRRVLPRWAVLLLGSSAVLAFLLWSVDWLWAWLLKWPAAYGAALKRAIAQVPEAHELTIIGSATLLLAVYLVLRLSRS